MPLQCHVCRKTAYLHPNLTFHRFPANKERRNIWFSVLGFDVNLKLPKHPVICSSHFDTADYFYKRDGKKYLQQDAVPKGFENPFFSSCSKDTGEKLLDEPFDDNSSETLGEVERSHQTKIQSQLGAANQFTQIGFLSASTQASAITGSSPNINIQRPQVKSQLEFQHQSFPETTIKDEETSENQQAQMFAPSESQPEAFQEIAIKVENELTDIQEPELFMHQALQHEFEETTIKTEDECLIEEPKVSLPLEFQHDQETTIKTEDECFIEESNVSLPPEFQHDQETTIKNEDDYLIEEPKVSLSPVFQHNIYQDAFSQTSLPLCEHIEEQLTNTIKKEIQLSDIEKYLEENYPLKAVTLIKQQLLLLNNTPKNGIYSNSFKQFALTLYMLGPKAYRQLSKIIRLPSKAILRRVTQKWKIYSEFNDFVFKLLDLKASVMPKKSRDCILTIDEMPIKSNLFYNISRDVITGFEQLHNKRSTDIATKALVVMVRSVSANWAHPIAYFFTKNSTSVDDLKKIIFEAVRRLKKVGFNILAITSDHAPIFYRLVKNYFKLTPDKPYMLIDNEVVFYIFDVPHLLKSTRNKFFSYTFNVNDGVTSKSYVEDLYNVDKKRQFRLAPKLSGEHLFPNKLQKLNVKLASEIFSHSVAVAMHTYMDFEQISTKGKATVNFIDNMSKLFALLNSHCSEEDSYAFRGTESQIEFLNKMNSMLLSLKVTDSGDQDVTDKLKFIYGWSITISSTLKLWEVLHSKGYNYLLTRNLSQDCLENYFEQIRNACGNSRKPTAVQFGKAYKNLLALNCLEQNESSICILEDASDILLAITPKLIEKTTYFVTEESIDKTNLKIQTINYRDLPIEEDGVGSVCAYLLRECLAKHSCDTCNNYYNLFLIDRSKQFTSLMMPPKSFLQYIKSLEVLFVSYFSTLCIYDNVGHSLVTIFLKVKFTHPCPEFDFTYLVSLYTRVRMYRSLKYANKAFMSQACHEDKKFMMLLQL